MLPLVEGIPKYRILQMPSTGVISPQELGNFTPEPSEVVAAGFPVTRAALVTEVRVKGAG